MPTTATTTEQKIADAMRRVASTLRSQRDAGERSASVSLNDFTEAFLMVADEIDPGVRIIDHPDLM